MSFFNKSYLIGLAGAGALGLVTGLIWYANSSTSIELSEAEWQAEKLHQQSVDQVESVDVVVAERKSKVNVLSPAMARLEKNPKLKKFVFDNKLEHHFEKLAPHFPEGIMGDNLLQFTTLLEMQEMVGSPEGKFVDEKFQHMKKHPEEALQILSTVFDSLPAEFANERQQLVQYASKLEADEEERLNFVMKEIKRPTARDADGKPVNKLALFNSSAAVRSLANVLGDDHSRLEPHLREALEAHEGDKETQRLLIHNFARFNPDAADKLRVEFRAE